MFGGEGRGLIRSGCSLVGGGGSMGDFTPGRHGCQARRSSLWIAGWNHKQVARLRDPHFLVRRGDGTRGRSVSMRDGVESLAFEDTMDAPTGTMGGGTWLKAARTASEVPGGTRN